MEKTSHLPTFLLFLGIVCVLLSTLAILFCFASLRTQSAGVPTANDSLAVSGIIDAASEEVVEEQSSTQTQAPPQSTQPSDDAPSAAPALPSYTVRLLPEQSEDTARCIGIYDGAQALILQTPVPLATLSLSDQQALLDGIPAPDFESAKLLLNDFCS